MSAELVSLWKLLDLQFMFMFFFVPEIYHSKNIHSRKFCDFLQVWIWYATYNCLALDHNNKKQKIMIQLLALMYRRQSFVYYRLSFSALLPMFNILTYGFLFIAFMSEVAFVLLGIPVLMVIWVDRRSDILSLMVIV